MTLFLFWSHENLLPLYHTSCVASLLFDIDVGMFLNFVHVYTYWGATWGAV